jgi:tetratricopeptide (TPR) repeat protein
MAKKKPAAKGTPKAAAGARRSPKKASPKAASTRSRSLLQMLVGDDLLAQLPPDIQARQLCEFSVEARTAREAKELLDEAERIDPTCPLIYVLRGERVGDPAAALPFFEKAIDVAEVGARKVRSRKRASVADQDRFLDLLEAHLGMASALEALRRPKEAIPHYEAAIGIDPGDRQVRDALALAYLAAGRDAEAARLVSSGEELDFFTKALIEFRRHGPTPVGAGFLRRGHTENPHIIRLLLGELPFGDDAPDNIASGSVGAAEVYLLKAMPQWRDTPGAVTWAREILGDEAEGARPSLAQRRTQVRDLLSELKAIKELDDDPWRLTLRPLHPEVPADVSQLACLTNSLGDTLYQSSLLDEVPNTETMLELIVDTAEERRIRPEEIQFDDARLLRRIETALGSIKIRSRQVVRDDSLDGAIENLRLSLVQSLDQGETISDSELQAVPKSDEVWLVDSKRLPRWVQNKRHQFVRPYSVMVVSASTRAIVNQRVEMDEARLPSIVWNTLARGMLRPMVGEAARPAEIRTRTHDLRIAIEPHARALGVKTVVSDEFGVLDSAHRDLIEHLAKTEDDDPSMSLLASGLSLELVEAYYRAAAGYYTAAPWKAEATDQAIEVIGVHWKKPHFATVIGQSGLLQGVCIYESSDDFVRTLESGIELEEINGLSVFFEEPQSVPYLDHDAFLDHNWPVAGPEAFPVAMRIRRGKAPVAPSAPELKMLTALLEVLPAFVQQGEETWEGTSSAGRLTLKRFQPPARAAKRPKKGRPKKSS